MNCCNAQYDLVPSRVDVVHQIEINYYNQTTTEIVVFCLEKVQALFILLTYLVVNGRYFGGPRRRP